MKRACVLFMSGGLAAVLAANVSAQSPDHTVSGGVYDSVAHSALAGAIVQAVKLDSAWRVTTKTFWAVADARGHFKIAGMPSGRFAVGFQHDALKALGLESPLRVVELGAVQDITLDLAIAPGMGIREPSCAGVQSNPSDGTFTGYVLAATSDTRLDSAAVDLHWIEVERTAGNVRTVPHHVKAAVTGDGKYVACGVPTNVPIGITVGRSGYRDLKGEITIAAGSAFRRDFHLSVARIEHGTATLTGRVVTADSVPINSGHFLIPALGVDVLVKNGAFTASGLPAGTWAAETRAIGYEPQSTIVDLVEQTTASATIVITNRVQPLEAMNIMGKPNADYRKLVKILEMKRHNFGTFFMPGDERLATAHSLRELLWTAPGFHIGAGGIEGRLGCHPTIFVDGIRAGPMPFLMRDVLAVAAYPDLLGTPINWRDGRTCAVIAVWTKQ